MSAFISVLTPFIVNGIVHLFKKLPSIASMESTPHASLLRGTALILSYVGVLAGTWLSGGQVDPASATTFISAFLTFLASTGSFFLVHHSQPTA